MKSQLTFLALSLAVSAEPLKIELPAEKIDLKPAKNREVLMANCLMCHSAEYITSQPPLPAAAWKGIVDKMRVKFGAPMADAQAAEVVEYLTANYGPAAPQEPGK